MLDILDLLDSSTSGSYHVVVCCLSKGSLESFSGVRTCGGLNEWSSHNANEASNLGDLVTQDFKSHNYVAFPLFTHYLLSQSSLPYLRSDYSAHLF